MDSGPRMVYTVWPWLPELVMVGTLILVASLFFRAVIRNTGRPRTIIAVLGLVAVGALVWFMTNLPTQDYRGYPVPCNWSDAFIKVVGPGQLSEVGEDWWSCRAPTRRGLQFYFYSAGVLATGALVVGQRPRVARAES